ncbi:MAG: hypothetical protein LH481_09880, partial [Burkholderiales bacterium]|nr:hypothetical protein [Burkholderiales bacterium]
MNARQKSPIRIANTFAIVIASALAAISPLAHADKAITFNVPVKLEKLDPVVNGFFVSCGVFGDGPQIVYKASPTTPISNGAYTGVVMTSL